MRHDLPPTQGANLIQLRIDGKYLLHVVNSRGEFTELSVHQRSVVVRADVVRCHARRNDKVLLSIVVALLIEADICEIIIHDRYALVLFVMFQNKFCPK
jgi:hypothetical protein